MSKLAVTDIPSIMDANRWPVAAKMLRRWFAMPSNSRTANKKGGDYLIYSDILYTKLAQPEVLSI